MSPEDDERDEPTTALIRVRPDGSYKVYGAVRVVDVDGRPYDLEPRRKPDSEGVRFKLCRCGNSKEMPFCDESHVETGFRSEPHVADLDDQPDARPGSD